MSKSRLIRDAMLAEFKAGESILLDVEAQRYRTANDTAAQIWKGLEEGESNAEIAAGLVREFDVLPAQAEESVARFVSELARLGFVEDTTTGAGA